MFNIEGTVAAPLEAAAEGFLDENDLKQLPDLIRSLHRVYVARALSVKPGITHEEASSRLIKIALALEGELFALGKNPDNFRKDTLEAYDLLARIFEYAARILHQKGGGSSEYWL